MPVERISILFALLVPLMGLVPGCGSSPNERAVEDTVNTFVNATLDEDYETACLQLSREAQAQLIRHAHAKSCTSAAYWAADTSEEDPAVLYDFTEVRFGPDGRSARVPPLIDTEAFEDLTQDKFGIRKVYPPIPLEQGDGRWRITKLDWYFET